MPGSPLAAVDLDIDTEADHNFTPHPELAAGASRLRASVRLPRVASTPFVLASLRALRVDPTLARRCPQAADPDQNTLETRG